MDLDMAKQATTDQPASTSAARKAARTKSARSTDARASNASTSKAEAAPAAREQNAKKGKRANDVVNLPEASPDKKPKKAKVIRDSFTMPEEDYRKLAELKDRCLAGGQKVKKSELLRAGLALLGSLPAKRLLAAVASVESVKTGRPAKPQA